MGGQFAQFMHSSGLASLVGLKTPVAAATYNNTSAAQAAAAQTCQRQQKPPQQLQ